MVSNLGLENAAHRFRGLANLYPLIEKQTPYWLRKYQNVNPALWHGLLRLAYLLEQEPLAEKLQGLDQAIALLTQQSVLRCPSLFRQLVSHAENYRSHASHMLLAAHIIRRGYRVELEPKVPGSNAKTDIACYKNEQHVANIEVYMPRGEMARMEIHERLNAELKHRGLHGRSSNYELSDNMGRVRWEEITEATEAVVGWLEQHPRCEGHGAIWRGSHGYVISAVPSRRGELVLGSSGRGGFGIPELPHEEWTRVFDGKKEQFSGRGPTIMAIDIATRPDLYTHFDRELVAIIDPAQCTYRGWSSSSAIRLSPSQIRACGFPALGSS